MFGCGLRSQRIESEKPGFGRAFCYVFLDFRHSSGYCPLRSRALATIPGLSDSLHSERSPARILRIWLYSGLYRLNAAGRKRGIAARIAKPPVGRCAWANPARAPGAGSPRQPDGLAEPSRVLAVVAATGAPVSPCAVRASESPSGRSPARRRPGLVSRSAPCAILAPASAFASTSGGRLVVIERTSPMHGVERERISHRGRPQRERPAMAGRSELGGRARCAGARLSSGTGCFRRSTRGCRRCRVRRSGCCWRGSSPRFGRRRDRRCRRRR